MPETGVVSDVSRLATTEKGLRGPSACDAQQMLLNAAASGRDGAAQPAAYPVLCVRVEVAMRLGAAIVVVQTFVVGRMAGVECAAPFVSLARRAEAIRAAIRIHSASAGRGAVIRVNAV